jgi:hypothetical protein
MPHSAMVRFRVRAGEPPAIDDASVVRWDIARPLEAACSATCFRGVLAEVATPGDVTWRSNTIRPSSTS